MQLSVISVDVGIQEKVDVCSDKLVVDVFQ